MAHYKKGRKAHHSHKMVHARRHKKSYRVSKKIRQIAKYEANKVVNHRKELKRVYEPTAGWYAYPSSANLNTLPANLIGVSIPTVLTSAPTDPTSTYYSFTSLPGIGTDQVCPIGPNSTIIPLSCRYWSIQSAAANSYTGIKSLIIPPIWPQNPSNQVTDITGVDSISRTGRYVEVHRYSIKIKATLADGIGQTAGANPWPLNPTTPADMANQFFDEFCNELIVITWVAEKGFEDYFFQNLKAFMSLQTNLDHMRRGTLPPGFIHFNYHIRMMKVKRLKFPQAESNFLISSTGLSATPIYTAQQRKRSHSVEMGFRYARKPLILKWLSNEQTAQPDIMPFMTTVSWFGCSPVDVGYIRNLTFKDQ
jgi:hypothetical protein